MSYYPDCIARCQHIKINGTQCGSPALRRNRFCYFHKRWADQRIRLNSARSRSKPAAFDLPLLEDANSIQVALMQVMRLLASNQLDHKTAGLLLYALQTASVNLRNTDFEPKLKTRVVINPSDVSQTTLNDNPWDPSQFEEEEEEETGAETPEDDEARAKPTLSQLKEHDEKKDVLEIQAVAADISAQPRCGAGQGLQDSRVPQVSPPLRDLGRVTARLSVTRVCQLVGALLFCHRPSLPKLHMRKFPEAIPRSRKTGETWGTRPIWRHGPPASNT